MSNVRENGMMARTADHALSNMHYYGEKLIQSVRIRDIVHGVEQTELKGECNAVREFGVSLHVFLVFESLQMKGEDVW